MNISEYLKWSGTEMPSWELARLLAAEQLLNSRGQRFLCEFGLDNAVPKAREVWASMKAKGGSKGW